MKSTAISNRSYLFVLIAVFTSALAAIVIFSIQGQKTSANLRQTLDSLNEDLIAINTVDAAIESLFRTENKFRLFTSTGKKEYLQEYQNELGHLSNQLRSAEQFIKGNRTQLDSIELHSLLNERQDHAKYYIGTQSIRDSLHSVVQALSRVSLQREMNGNLNRKNKTPSLVIRTETVIRPAKTEKKGIFKRLAAAIGNKQPRFDTITSKHSYYLHASGGHRTSSAAQKLAASVKKLTLAQQKLKDQETALIRTNEKLLHRLSETLRHLKKAESRIKSEKARVLKSDTTEGLAKLGNISELTQIIAILLTFIVLFNVWRLYQSEKQLVAAKNTALRQTKIKGEFLAHMSHEIRTPLNSILGFSEQLENSELSEEQSVQLTGIRHSSELLLKIVNEILDLSKLETGKLSLSDQNFSPARSISEIAASLKILADKKGIGLSTKVHFSEDVILSGDEYRLKQVLINIVNNAIKFTEQGTVTIQAKLSSKNTLNIDVTDTGRGIRKEDIPSLFNEFTQIKPGESDKQNGSGLGLAICKRIVEAMNGTIKVESKLKEGSCFRIEIPLKPAAEQATLKPIPDTPASVFSDNPDLLSNKRLLVVDDNKMNILLLKMILKKWKVVCDEACDGGKGLELFVQHNYDLVLTDIHMPVLDGIALTKKIRSNPDRRKATVPVLAITANTAQKDIEAYLQQGINDYVVKPFSENELYEKVAKYCMMHESFVKPLTAWDEKMPSL
ncbi:ATP-binding protein [Arcticibacter sp. MXS-1]|uniref:ATP-binding protein n=1 Tax=Arcticibacter sp. MXS-1 TaxID=3341726 RepID=UPI0035A8BF90